MEVGKNKELTMVEMNNHEKMEEGGKRIEDQEEDHHKGSARQRHLSMDEPPDGGWGWVMVLGAGLGLSIITGFNKSVTLLYEQMLTRFGQSAAATASVISMNGTIRMVASPLVSILIHHTSHRTVGILAGVACSLGLILTSIMPSLPYVYITYGFLQATGVAMYIVSDLSMVNLYFSKNRGKANALRSCFLGIGALYMTQLLSFLFDEYGYTGTLLIIGALMLNIIPASGLFRPLQRRFKITLVKDSAQDGNNATESTGQNETAMRTNNTDTHQYTISDQNDPRNCQENCEQGTLGDNQDMNIVEKEIHQPKSRIVSCICRGFSKCCTMLGLNALKNPGFCICVCLMASFSVINSMNMSFLAGLALEKGFTEKQVPLTMSLNFGTEIPSRLFSGLLFDLPFIRDRRLLVFVLLSFMMGVVVACQPFIPVLIPAIALWMLQSALMGAFQAQSGTVMADCVPRATITSSVALMRLIQGVGNLLGPSIGGVLRDTTGSYFLGYIVAGAQMITLSTICMIIICCKLRK